MFRHFRSVGRLRQVVAISLAASIVSGVVSVYLIREMATGSELQAEIGSAQIASMSLYAYGLQMCQATRNIVLDPSNQTAYANFGSAVRDFDATLQDLERRSEKLFPESDARQTLAGVGLSYRSHVDTQRRIHQAARNGDFEQGRKILNSEDTPLWRKYKESILDYAKWLEQKGNQTSRRIQATSHWAQLLAWLAALLLAATSLAAFTASGTVAGKLKELSRVLLTGSTQIADAARQVSTCSELLARTASEQAESLEETSASGEEVRSVARRNSENSQSATAVVARSQELFTAANRMLDETVAAMGQINNSSDKIARIIRVIDEIAFQTNILALNAAVEAARAGQAGMGFGVVADEVRNLAQRCGQAATETTSLIEESIAEARNGRAKVDQVTESVRNIIVESGRVKMLVEEVSLGSADEAKGIEQIANALSRIEQMTQKTAASAQESASAAQELNAQSETLERIVEDLIAVTGG